ncbi:hypothetical protein Ndes2437B_g03362 [Nannochloris sp. 'desiccata']
MMKKAGLCLLALVLMASSIQMATASKVPTGPHNAKVSGVRATGEGADHMSDKAAAKVSGVRAKVSGIRERLGSHKAGNHPSMKMDGGAL